ncbi:hypothetical protein J437_LFUL012988 [Ladona fulva]|uniref:SHSP domain-containing protein n=1 Tax=Ladona fulva TaxID=123851 RepID=A0A8K0P580_LADFU|nr:hypothetical protein J437_LFUL012988 [Ladona fulva]
MAFFPISVLDPLIAVQRSLMHLQNSVGEMARPIVNQVQQHAMGYYRPWQLVPGPQSGISKVHMDKDHFQIDLDVQRFTLEEITVKAVGNCIVIEGKHEEKEDEHGFVSRNFVRRYDIPKGVDVEGFTSHLSPDGMLTITAPIMKPAKGSNGRTVPITVTREPAKKEVAKK